jgi:hypothetical protein
MPADLGGAICIHLAKAGDAFSIEGRLTNCVAQIS